MRTAPSCASVTTKLITDKPVAQCAPARIAFFQRSTAEELSSFGATKPSSAVTQTHAMNHRLLKESIGRASSTTPALAHIATADKPIAIAKNLCPVRLVCSLTSLTAMPINATEQIPSGKTSLALLNISSPTCTPAITRKANRED